MELRLEPVSPAGARFGALAEEHAREIALRAAEHDREGTFPFEAFDAMKASGFVTATVPAEFGGFGVDSTADLAAALARLAVGDASVAIAVNMHLAFGLVMGWLLRTARDSNDAELAAGLELLLPALATGTIAMANTTEVGTDLGHPMLQGTRAEGGWLLNGRKTFGTLSPVADLFLVSARLPRDDGTWAGANAFVGRGSPGQEIGDNWDALGMRASGSHDVAYRDCFVPDGLVFEGGDWGVTTPVMLVTVVSANLGLLGCFLGVAESAREAAVEVVRRRRKGPDGRALATFPGIQHAVAEIDADLAVIRALIERTARLVDRVVFRGPPADVTLEVLHALNHQFQCAKLVVNRKAIDVVDGALTVSGGAGYLTANPLSRLYRDVRAGPFMQPFSPNEAHEYIGRVALGLDPEVTR